jgi:hypothetical protein
VACVAFHPDLPIILTGSEDGSVPPRQYSPVPPEYPSSSRAQSPVHDVSAKLRKLPEVSETTRRGGRKESVEKRYSRVL